MYIRRTKGGSKKKPIYYLQLVYSYRDKNGKPRQKVLCTLGREDEFINSDMPEKLAKRFAALKNTLIIIDKDKEAIGDTKLLGAILALEAIWKRLGLDKLLAEVKKKYKIKFDLNRAVKLMVLNRITDPKSKLSISRWKRKLYGDEYKGIKLQHLYRSLDILAEHKDMLQRGLYKRALSLFKPEVKVVFYDLTTLYFESQNEDELRRYGYSKDNKVDCVQVVLGMILSKDGIPLGYELFEGNKFEGKTVKRVIEKLKREYSIEKLIFVGDKGILSRKVLEEIEKAGYEYIVAAKVKRLGRRYESEIKDLSKYKELSEDVKYRELDVGGRRLIVYYSEKRALRERAIREELIEKLREKLKQGRVIKSIYRRYLRVEGTKMEIDDEKIKEQESWDGFFGFYTNAKELDARGIISAYKELWRIEDSFRSLKSTLKIRPIYHWTEKRIEGHIMMSFLSFYVLRAMERMVIEAGIEMSPERMIEELDEIRAVEIKTDKRVYIVRTEIKGKRYKILRALGVKIPPFVLSESPVVE